MDFETHSMKQSIMDFEEEVEEGVMNFEGELISSLDELMKVRKKNKKLKE